MLLFSLVVYWFHFCPYRASAEEAIQRMQGMMIGQQVVRISWGRSPTAKQVIALLDDLSIYNASLSSTIMMFLLHIFLLRDGFHFKRQEYVNG